MAAWMAACFSSSVPPRESIACFSKAWAAALSAKPLPTAVSISASFASRLAAWDFTASSTAASFSSAVPLSEARACCSSSCCDWLSAKPLLTAASISASLVSRLVVWDFTASSMAASFSSMLPVSEATA